MEKTEYSDEKADRSKLLQVEVKDNNGTNTKQQEKIPHKNKWNAIQFLQRFVIRPISCVIQWLDKHDGIVTSTATVAIAYLTWSLAEDSRRQANTANDQFNIMRGQLNAMEAEQRPWVSVPPKDGFSIVEPLTFGAKTGAAMRLYYKLRNTGKSPGLHVRVQAKIVSPPKETWMAIEIANIQSSICEPMRHIEEQFSDAIIFPGDEIDGNFPVSVSTTEIESWLKKSESGNFAHPGFISPFLIVCFDYQFASDHTRHFQTRYAFMLGVPMQPGGFIMGDIKPEGARPDVQLIYFSQSAD